MAGTRYMSRRVKALSLPPYTDAKQSLITLIEVESADLEDENWLETTLRTDVWSNNFLDGILISTSPASISSPLPALVASITRLNAWHAIISGLDLPVSIYRRLAALRVLTTIDRSLHTL